MSYSNTSLNCFASCMHKYELQYIQGVKPDAPPTPHMEFGVMAHKVLYDAGCLRDEQDDDVKPEYTPVIPSEVLYPELKEYFKIQSWTKYFTNVIKAVAEREETLVNQMLDYGKSVVIERERRFQLEPAYMQERHGITLSQPLVGIVDLLLTTKDHACIIDYKFSANRKTQSDFDLNSQLQLYAFLVSETYHISPRNILIGYIDIPKQDLDYPEVLKNGTLSRSKTQNCTAEAYKDAVLRQHGEDDYYNCEKGGYYYETYCNLMLNQPAYLSVQWLDRSSYNNILTDLLDTCKVIEWMQRNDLPFLRKYDSYSCKGCEYLNTCKPWLGVEK